jgi:hypothetical protein
MQDKKVERGRRHSGSRCCTERLYKAAYIQGTRDAGAAETSTKDTNITYINIHGRRHNTALELLMCPHPALLMCLHTATNVPADTYY